MVRRAGEELWRAQGWGQRETGLQPGAGRGPRAGGMWEVGRGLPCGLPPVHCSDTGSGGHPQALPSPAPGTAAGRGEGQGSGQRPAHSGSASDSLCSPSPRLPHLQDGAGDPW